VLNSFNFDYGRNPAAFGPAVNSHPDPNYFYPFQHVFRTPGPSTTYEVRLRVIEPYHDGITSLGRVTPDVVRVTVTGGPAGPCFNVSGVQQAGSDVTFDASCSGNTGYLEYDWDFGDGQTTGFAGSNRVVSHSYAAAGSKAVTLRIRLASGEGPTLATSQAVTIAAPVAVTISGPDWITESGTYSWFAAVSGGIGSSSCQWYYSDSGSETPVTGLGCKYRRTVTVGSGSTSFRLRVVATDEAGTTAEDLRWVLVGAVPF
jgi:hypothetical protein